jgi:hypothetical protein
VQYPLQQMPLRFSSQRGVTVQIIDYGMTQSAPFYETLYAELLATLLCLHSWFEVQETDLRIAVGFEHPRTL